MHPTPMHPREKATRPEDLTRLFVECANDGDAEGIAALYEENAVMAYPPGAQTVGRDAIRALWDKVLANSPHFEQETPLPTLVSGDVALTSTPPGMGRVRGRRWSAGNPTGRGCVCSTSPSSCTRVTDTAGAAHPQAPQPRHCCIFRRSSGGSER